MSLPLGIEDTFSTIVPASVVKPNMRLSFQFEEKQGELKNVTVGGSSNLIINTIDIGLLTPYRDKFTFQNDPDLHRQYFQQVPLSKLTVNKFEPIHLTEVMLPNGNLLTDSDPSKGGVYSGDMRHQIAKPRNEHDSLRSMIDHLEGSRIALGLRNYEHQSKPYL